MRPLSNLSVPKHLGVIIDGNRRWARARGLNPWEGHWRGAQKLEKFLEWCYELKIPQVSVYTLSTENLNRPKRELEELFRIFEHYLKKWEKGEPEFLKKYRVKIRFIGDLERLPKPLVELMRRIMKKTARYQRKILNILIAYGSKFELTEVVRKLTETAIRVGKVEITERDIEQNLLVPSPLDLIIRTGGAYRLSNFLLWQAAYSELIFLDKLWPDITKRDLIKCIKEFDRRERRFGR